MADSAPAMQSRWLLLALVAITLVAILPGNSESRRLRHHEILVAQTASEMLQSGDYLVPHVMGLCVCCLVILVLGLFRFQKQLD